MPDEKRLEKNTAEKAVVGAALPNGAKRRRRYARAAAACVSLTLARIEILRYLAEMRFLSLPQIARLCCPSARTDLAAKAARRHMRVLFDGGLVDVLAISRAALAPPGTHNDASLLYGSAPNVYTIALRGLEALHRAGLANVPDEARKRSAYGPRNSLFLAHELAVRDVRVWLDLTARENGYGLERWQDAEAAAIGLKREHSSFAVRPDAWFVLRLGRAVLVGLVEVDRGTERGDRRWGEKLAAYGALFAGGVLASTTGYANARVLVIAPDARRRDRLGAMIGEADEGLASRFWIAEKSVLDEARLSHLFWRRPGGLNLQALVPPG